MPIYDTRRAADCFRQFVSFVRLTAYPNYSRHRNEVPHSAWHQELNRFEGLMKAQIDDSQNRCIDTHMRQQRGPPEWIRRSEGLWLYGLYYELCEAEIFLKKSLSRRDDSNSKEGSENKAASGKETGEGSSKKNGPQDETPSLASSLVGDKTVLQAHYWSIGKRIFCLTLMAELTESHKWLQEDVLSYMQAKICEEVIGLCALRLKKRFGIEVGDLTTLITQTDGSDENHGSVQTDSDETFAGDEDATSASEA